ncbi:MAG TPA: ligase-associated DNA damage response endonuclease PdeM [Rhodobacteraceae bacterium]|nr:ligase-associated DNA damage response endonuclease PdeM [Paracoccaceae bacterium]
MKNAHKFGILGEPLIACASGVLWIADRQTLVVSDLHLGKSGRVVRRGGPMLPPVETRDTLARLETEIERTGARTVVCLGDSFDDLEAGRQLPEDEGQWLGRLQAGREWIWIEGNHDPGPFDLGGSHLRECQIGPLTLRHIALAGDTGEISGHYHPKFILKSHGSHISRPCFLYDAARLILPAFGAFTGGMNCHEPELRKLFGQKAFAVTIGRQAQVFPLPAAHSTTRFRLRRGNHG